MSRQTRRTRGGIGVFVLALLALSCGDQSGSPQPVPIPDPKQFRCTGVLRGQPVDVSLLGLPQATGGVGQVLVRNITRGGEVRVQASESGSFVAAFEADAKDLLEVSFEGSRPVSFEVPEIGPTASPPPSAISGVPPVESRPEGGARVRGKVAAGVRSVIAVALTSGDVVVAAVDGLQRFDLTLRAASGEQIEVYNEALVLQGVWSLSVP